MKQTTALEGKQRLSTGLFILIVIAGAMAACVSTNRASPTGSSPPQATDRSPAEVAPTADLHGKGKNPNRLINEKSPYLLQHAYNPVDWYPWGDAAFRRARTENKPIFLSIGYSTCYWCHVMERQIFENEELAGLMNQYFVSIKVDREERPDIDRIYMSALQAMRGSGGWPMSMFLAPDLKPFYGSTYIPPEQFRIIIDRVHELWTTEPEKLIDSSQRLTEFIKRRSTVEATRIELEQPILTKAFGRFQQGYDQQYGGFGNGPKFPRPVAFSFLLRYYSRFGDQQALQMVLTTLRQMANGGIRDHLGGGFHRYSVDGQWRVPHFEKMLYDQAQLVNSYLDAYQITGDEFYASIAGEILGYVRQRMTHPEGGFYSAEDAESAPDPQKPTEKEEGAFYVWAKEDIDQILGNAQAEIFDYVYGVQAGGNALEDPHHVFVGKNILYLAHNLDETAKKFDTSPDAVSKLLQQSRAKLLTVRRERMQPHLDDKILVSWNGLMISAFARASQVLDDPAALRAAKRAAQCILEKLYHPKTKQLLRRYREGEARFEGQLADYAFFTMGLLDLYEASLEIGWLKQAMALTEKQNALFYDEKNGGFFDTSGNDKTLLIRTKGYYDTSEPTGNSIALLNLLRLAQMANNQNWRELAERGLKSFGQQLQETPTIMPQMLVALDYQLDKPKQIIIAGDQQKDDTKRMLREVHKRFIPNKVILLADTGPGREFLGHYVPIIKDVKMLDGKATAYICQNYACQLPTSDLRVMARLLGGKEKRGAGG